MKAKLKLKKGFTDVTTASVSLSKDKREGIFDNLSKDELKALEDTESVDIEIIKQSFPKERKEKIEAFNEKVKEK